MNENHAILYIDDEPINLMLFETNFKRKYKITTAASGIEGLEKLRHFAFNIVISDMKMPGMNGIEFISQAKQEFPNVVYFILTGFHITVEISEALRSKLIFKYFNKPFNLSEIEEGIEEALKSI